MLRVLNKAQSEMNGKSKQPGKKARMTMMAISVSLAAGILSGCATHKTETDDLTTSSIDNDYRSRHPIVVSENEIIQDFAVSSSKRTLSQRDINLAVELTRRFKNSGAKSIRIIRPIASRNEHAGRHVSRGIAHQVKKLGVPSSAIRHLTYNASEHGDAATVRVSFDALTAQVESKCGQWDENLSENTENRNYTNFGCATQNNLASMVSNPADLLGPRGQESIDAERRDVIITDWRADGAGTTFDE